MGREVDGEEGETADYGLVRGRGRGEKDGGRGGKGREEKKDRRRKS